MDEEQIKAALEEIDQKLTEVRSLYATLLTAAEIDPQVVRMLQQVLGGTTLSSLSDLDINSPSNGQVLKYRSSDGKWYNGTDDIGAS